MKRLFRLSDSRPDPVRDVDDEIRFHLEMRAQEFMEQGLAPEDARRAAAESFGDVAAIEAECRGVRTRRTRERVRRERLRRFAVDVTLAMRTLRKHPAFTLAAILTLALGIGATTAVFSVVDAVLLRPLPYPESDRLVSLGFTAPGLGYDEMPFSDAVYLYVRGAQRTLEGLALFVDRDVNLSGGGEPVRVAGEAVTPGFFHLLGVPPALGRAFTPADGEPGAEPVAILSHALWVSRFGADPGIVGRSVMMDGVAHRVVGIAPQDFAFPDATVRVWLPLVVDPAHLNAGSFSYPCFGRLRPGATLASAHADLERLAAHISDVVSGLTPAVVEKARFAPTVRSLKERSVGDVRRPLWIVLGTGACVLLIACANVANLFLVRAEGRGRELALRTALGASRGDLAGLMLGESLLLALVGGTLGLGLATFGVQGLLALAPATIPRAQEIGLNGDVLLFTLAVSILAGLLFGGIPVLRSRALQLSAALRGSGRLATPGRERGRARGIFVAVQVALALVLLVGAGLMMRTFQAMRAVDPGFRPDSVVTFEIALSREEYPTGRQAAAFWRALVERVGALPGVQSAAAANSLPLGANVTNGQILIEDHPVPEGSLPPVAEWKYVSPGYFETLGIPLLEGRTFDRHDGADGFHGVVVNRAFARHWWPGGGALGARIRGSASDPWYVIVGVVGDVRFRSLEKVGEDAVYFPVPAGSATSPAAPRHVAVAVRAAGDPATLMPAVRAQVKALDPYMPIANLRTMRSVVNHSMARTSFVLVLLGIAAAVALLLGVVGIYGVIAYIVSQRRREIGVRMALGATSRDVRGMVVRQGVRLAAVGVVVGLGAAFALSRLLGTLLYGVSASDPMTYAAVAAVLLGVAALASYLPARRASAIDPMESLRQE